LVRHRKLTAREAARKLANIIEKHLETLPEPERAARLEAFHNAVSNAVGTRAKRAKPLGTRVSRLSALRPA
jgi:hypothetical protein